jgi:hypothetical protein
VATPSAITPGGNSNLATTISYASSWAVSLLTRLGPPLLILFGPPSG